MRIVYIFEHEYRIIKNLICNEEYWKCNSDVYLLNTCSFFTLHLLFPISIWTFISLLFLDFYFRFIFVLFSFYFRLIFFLFLSYFRLIFILFSSYFRLIFVSPFLFGLLFNRGHILDFFQIFF